MKSQKSQRSRRARRVILSALAGVGISLLVACGTPGKREVQAADLQRRQEGVAMWKARCDKAGVFIHRTVENVEGIYLVNVRTRINFGESVADQFRLDDPYGTDSTNNEYIHNFLRGFYHHPHRKPAPYEGALRLGFDFVEAVDPRDGKLYRFTSRVEEPGLTDKSYLKGYTRRVLDRKPIEERSARYGVKFEDISTRQEREYWIAGSSLKVIDLDTDEVLGERIGYMVDWAQGSRAGHRAPWRFAADNACPDFLHGEPRRAPAASSQAGQTLDFVELVLKAKSRDE